MVRRLQSKLPFITNKVLFGKTKKMKIGNKVIFVKHGCFFIEKNFLIVGATHFIEDIEIEEG